MELKSRMAAEALQRLRHALACLAGFFRNEDT